ncbi:hypothetical protein CROQUDRAFT_659090 [Cronartium quercuum f. sp. fusiforme G11]|uniref:1-alkyl-2-acetylglycerophosphocholine esterase n=1 Tax=Cronartium quercuum f. sp. fusiforme G11 TaxID=708437 RepID=A0A9P6NJ87_9BASI|nr:hypothetical protein CROQUDRAFT_659090 [Cronartium quercuum f. sp. fusiforme G11]
MRDDDNVEQKQFINPHHQIYKRTKMSNQNRFEVPKPLHRSKPPSIVETNSTKTNSFETKKYRGRWSWTDFFSLFYLPRYDGPYNVGTLTLELPIPDSIPRPVPALLRLKKPLNAPAFELTNSLTTIYYPTESARTSTTTRIKWITLSQIKGYLKFACLSLFKCIIAIPIAILMTWNIRLPTIGNAPLAISSKGKRQVIFFCHGLTGNRTCYSQYCGQLASRGYVVVAIEHRDRSGAHSIINSKPNIQLNYIDMEDLTDQTRPPNYLIARAYQLEIRVYELLAACQLLGKFNDINGWKEIKDSNVRIKGSSGYFGDDGSNWSTQQWKTFSENIEWNQDLILAGHSFGSATILAAKRYPNSPKEWKKLIVLDPWMETLEYWPKTALKLNSEKFINVPLLVINSPGFSLWYSHFNKLFNYLNSRESQTWFFTINGIIHSSFSDLPIIFERLWKLKGQLKLSSQIGLDIIIKSSIEFIEFNLSSDLEPNEIISVNDEIVVDDEIQLNKVLSEKLPGKLIWHVKNPIDKLIDEKEEE